MFIPLLRNSTKNLLINYEKRRKYCLPICQKMYATTAKIVDDQSSKQKLTIDDVTIELKTPANPELVPQKYGINIEAIIKTKKPGDKISIRGWIKNIRRLKNHIFLDINDGSSSIKFQTVVPKTDAVKTVSANSLINVEGVIQVAPNGSYELHAEHVNVIAEGNLSDGYPFVPKQQLPPEYVREHLHLRSRVDYIAAMLRVRHRAKKAIHDFMDEQNFVQIDTPIVTTNDCEGAGEVFTVQPDSKALLKEMSRAGIPIEDSYFDTKVFLSVSGQLHLEAMTHGLGNTYCLAPAFRAENSKSPLHLAEFYMYEAELAYMDKMEELTQFIELMLKRVSTEILEKCETDLQHCQQKATGSNFPLTWLQKAWSTLGYNEALDIVLKNKAKFQTAVKPNEGFSKEQELFLVKHCDAPVFVVDWPKDLKPFYMRRLENNEQYVHALDLLMPTVGELCGGSLREFDLQKLRSHPMYPKGLDWYLELRKFGGIPTGGFGMGFERYLQLITGIKNIRDVIPFPRYPHSCKM